MHVRVRELYIAPVDNLNAEGSHGAGAGPPFENANAAGPHIAGAGAHLF
jgi:hypothetical protein